MIVWYAITNTRLALLVFDLKLNGTGKRHIAT